MQVKRVEFWHRPWFLTVIWLGWSALLVTGAALGLTATQFLGLALMAHAPLLLAMAVRSTVPPMVENILIKADPPKKHEVNLVGVDYVCTVPKKALALALTMRVRNAGNDPELVNDAVDALIKKMFGSEVAPAVHARLADGDDDLDIDHIMELMNALITVATSPDPTTSPSDSSTTP